MSVLLDRGDRQVRHHGNGIVGDALLTGDLDLDRLTTSDRAGSGVLEADRCDHVVVGSRRHVADHVEDDVGGAVDEHADRARGRQLHHHLIGGVPPGLVIDARRRRLRTARVRRCMTRLLSGGDRQVRDHGNGIVRDAGPTRDPDLDRLATLDRTIGDEESIGGDPRGSRIGEPCRPHERDEGRDPPLVGDGREVAGAIDRGRQEVVRTEREPGVLHRAGARGEGRTVQRTQHLGRARRRERERRVGVRRCIGGCRQQVDGRCDGVHRPLPHGGAADRGGDGEHMGTVTECRVGDRARARLPRTGVETALEAAAGDRRLEGEGRSRRVGDGVGRRGDRDDGHAGLVADDELGDRRPGRHGG